MKTQVALLSVLASAALAQTSHPLETQKECPDGYEFIGKQCVLIERASLDWLCPENYAMFGHRCAVFKQKTAECPPSFHLKDGKCLRTVTVAPIVSCRLGYFLTGPKRCTRLVALPPTHGCPATSVARGDKCFEVTTHEAAYHCLPEWRQEGATCVFEEVFDCTGLPGTHCVGNTASTGATLQKVKEKATAAGKHGPALVEEFVVAAQCKRQKVEPARKLCPFGGRLDGKQCIVETEVKPISIPGGTVEEELAAIQICPDGFESVHESDHQIGCVRHDIAPATFECPENTEDVGDRCAAFAERRAKCPESFHRHDDHCVRVTYAEPITEWTVKYTCTGEDCQPPK